MILPTPTDSSAALLVPVTIVQKHATLKHAYVVSVDFLSEICVKNVKMAWIMPQSAHRVYQNFGVQISTNADAKVCITTKQITLRLCEVGPLSEKN